MASPTCSPGSEWVLPSQISSQQDSGGIGTHVWEPLVLGKLMHEARKLYHLSMVNGRKCQLLLVPVGIGAAPSEDVPCGSGSRKTLTGSNHMGKSISAATH